MLVVGTFNQLPNFGFCKFDQGSPQSVTVYFTYNFAKELAIQCLHNRLNHINTTDFSPAIVGNPLIDGVKGILVAHVDLGKCIEDSKWVMIQFRPYAILYISN